MGFEGFELYLKELLGKVYFLRKGREGHKKKATLLVKHKIKK